MSRSILPMLCADWAHWPRRCERWPSLEPCAGCCASGNSKRNRAGWLWSWLSANCNRLEHALTATAARERRGRSLVQASAHSGQLPDRLAGLEETRSSLRHAAALGPRIEATGDDVAALRQEFLGKRVERRQAETLIQETEAEDAIGPAGAASRRWTTGTAHGCTAKMRKQNRLRPHCQRAPLNRLPFPHRPPGKASTPGNPPKNLRRNPLDSQLAS